MIFGWRHGLWGCEDRGANSKTMLRLSPWPPAIWAMAALSLRGRIPCFLMQGICVGCAPFLSLPDSQDWMTQTVQGHHPVEGPVVLGAAQFEYVVGA